jgi:oligopeptide transport system ATP-binding protein
MCTSNGGEILAPKVLDVNNLATHFKTNEGTVHAVNGISFHVEEGETLGIVGESGCGKSVSMLSILKLLPQPPANISADSIRFRDTELTKASTSELHHIRGSKIAMIFQDPMTCLNPVLTVGFQIMEPLRIHLGMHADEARSRASELLHLVGISEAHDHLADYPHQFSGGMRQRAMIAMALACNPDLLIADEPTTALDVTIQAQIIDLVKRLRDKLGMSLIWITHDLGIVAGLADRVNVMYAGFIIETAPIVNVYLNPRHPYTAALLRSLPRMDGSPGEQLESIEGMPPELLDLPHGCPFAPRCTFTKDICWHQNPHLQEVDSEHWIACWVDITTGKTQ